jgi:hypothetical protein
MIIEGHGSTLAEISKNLSADWRETEVHWRDAKAREFRREYLDELPTQIARAVETIGELDRLLQKVRSECE